MKGVKIEKVINVNGRRYSEAMMAAKAISQLITFRIDARMAKKHGQAWYHIVGVDHIHNLTNRAYRRVLPVCERILSEDSNNARP